MTDEITLEKVKETIKILAKKGWEYIGFEYGDLGDVFIKHRNPFTYRIQVGCESISFSCLRWQDGDYKEEGFRFFREMEEFYILYEYVKQTRRCLPNELATSQEKLDDAARFEFGDSTCDFW